MVLGGGTFGWRSGLEGGTLLIGISSLIKETLDSQLVPSTPRGYSEEMALSEEASPQLISTPQPPEP